MLGGTNRKPTGHIYLDKHYTKTNGERMAKRKRNAREISENAWRTRETICMGKPEVTLGKNRKELIAEYYI